MPRPRPCACRRRSSERPAWPRRGPSVGAWRPSARRSSARRSWPVSYHHVWFSQNARGYTGLLFFTLLGSRAFVLLLARRGGGLGLPAQYGAWMALAAYTHATAVLVVAAHGLVWLALLVTSRARTHLGRNRWMPLAGFACAALFALTLYALVLPQFLDTLLAPTMPGKQTGLEEPELAFDRDPRPAGRRPARRLGRSGRCGPRRRLRALELRAPGLGRVGGAALARVGDRGGHRGHEAQPVAALLLLLRRLLRADRPARRLRVDRAGGPRGWTPRRGASCRSPWAWS